VIVSVSAIATASVPQFLPMIPFLLPGRFPLFSTGRGAGEATLP